MYNEEYFDIIDFEFNGNKNNFFVSFNNTNFDTFSFKTLISNNFNLLYIWIY